MKFELWLKTRFGAISLEFGSVDELKGNFLSKSDIDSIDALVEGSGIALVKARTPKPGLEDVYRFSHDGLVELVLQPASAVEEVGLVSFAYDPQGATIEQISRSSGVKKDSIYAYFAQQPYKDYFTKYADGKFGLTYQGKQWAQKIVDKLRQSLMKKEMKSPDTKEGISS